MCLSTFLGVAFDPVKPEAPLYFVEAMEVSTVLNDRLHWLYAHSRAQEPVRL